MQRQIMKEPTLMLSKFLCIMCLNNLDVSSTYVYMISLSYAGHEFEMQHKFMILTAVNNLRKLNVESWTLA